MSYLPMPPGVANFATQWASGFDPSGGFGASFAPSTTDDGFTGNPAYGSGGAGGAGASPYGLSPSQSALMASILGNQQSGLNTQTAANASMYGSGANAAASEQNGYLGYLANVLQANNSLQGQLGTAQIGAMSANNIAATNAGAADYATDEQRQQAALQNQAQNLASSVQNQDSLANTAANQFSTQAGMQNELVNAQQQ